MMDQAENVAARRRALAEDAPAVLIVDDNHSVTRTLSAVLREAGYRPAVYHLGLEALAHAEQELPAMAVVDVHLPDVSGLVVSSRLRERLGPDAPIILMSGDTSMENIRSLSFVGASYFIGKPFRAEQVLDRLNEAKKQG